MCFSAIVTQTLNQYFRGLGVRLDYAEALRLYRQRLEDPKLKISRGFDANFMEPKNDDEREIKKLIDEYRDWQGSEEEKKLFEQKTRLNQARRILSSSKPTKKAANDERIAINKIEAATRALSNLRRTTREESDDRIFPGHFAGVVIRQGDDYLLTPMRYRCRIAGQPSFLEKKYDGNYNARRDNLKKYWRPLFGKQHALMVVRSFYENVDRHVMEHRELAPGEKEDNVVLHFVPDDKAPMLIACMWDTWTSSGEPELRSFTAITDEPPEEVAAAGHDRCIINLKADHVRGWLSPEKHDLAHLETLLDDKNRPFYGHEVIAA
jgi:putative SOS response-associated peptidase YedK